ncbi:hypothetical protein E4T50_02494 [Aureobasidium sp. EXF-12298]|nr:hypothetical protein E4T50_02494 [Aureobasidium sp. EXF-12298]KAI4753310.1 hypothetical protein E4T51_13566 [Aureobasidium sp. EXF-12344]
MVYTFLLYLHEIGVEANSENTGFRSTPLHLQPRNQNRAPQVPSRNLEGKGPASRKDQIDKKTLEISKADDETYTDLSILGEELPDHSPRFILLSYPLTMASGRLSVPYVMLYYLPVTCNSELKMVYAGAKELMRNQAEVGRIIEIDSVEELEEIEDQLRGEE